MIRKSFSTLLYKVLQPDIRFNQYIFLSEMKTQCFVYLLQTFNPASISRVGSQTWILLFTLRGSGMVDQSYV